jgi:hypothetical protein
MQVHSKKKLFSFQKIKKMHEGIKSDLYKFVRNNPEMPKPDVVHHFLMLGYKRRSLYHWLKAIEQKKSLKRKKGSGRPAAIATKRNIIRIKNHFNHKSGLSQRSYARRLGCTQSYISMILKRSSSIKVRKKFKKPLMKDTQKACVRSKCRTMLTKYRELDFILDDESYFTLDHSAQPGNNIFYSSNVNLTPDNVKYKFQEKYPEKLLVYLAISPKGVSKPFFVPSGLAVNQKVYLESCVKKVLEPFIRKHYKQGKYVFWPDLASSHYAYTVQDYLKEKNINFVPKWLNPANVPKVICVV